MSEPLGTVPEEIVDAADAVRRGEIEADEAQLVATFKVAPQDVQGHVLAALGTVRRRQAGRTATAHGYAGGGA